MDKLRHEFILKNTKIQNVTKYQNLVLTVIFNLLFEAENANTFTLSKISCIVS